MDGARLKYVLEQVWVWSHRRRRLDDTEDELGAAPPRILEFILVGQRGKGEFNHGDVQSEHLLEGWCERDVNKRCEQAVLAWVTGYLQ